MCYSAHGRELAALGFGKDLVFASVIDRYNIAPCFESGQIVLRETASESGPKP